MWDTDSLQMTCICIQVFFSANLLKHCLQMLNADRTDKIWTQTILHSRTISERIFFWENILKKKINRRQKDANYPNVKELKTPSTS